MKYFFYLISAILYTSFSACTSLKKDNKTQQPTEIKAEVKSQLDLYRTLISAQLDEHGLVVIGDSIGDSALFSCLAMASGAIDFDPTLFLIDGKPVRHPDIKPDISKTPVSKDMVNGLLWCAYSLGDKATGFMSAMIDFGKAHAGAGGWLFCTEEDRKDFGISDQDWVGKCFMTPAVIKDIYRVAKFLKMPCDNDCKFWSEVGVNIPAENEGFARHLAVISTVRNGLIEGAINDNSLKQLGSAADEQPNNALYQAALHVFTEGNQTEAFTALLNTDLFPKDSLPASKNYCTEYLFQRDYPSSDWEPCDGSGESDGRGIDWAFTAAIALGKLQ